MRSMIFLLSLISFIWAFPYKDQGDSAHGQKVGKWTEYTEGKKAWYFVSEGNYINGKREGLWSEKRVGSPDGEVYDVIKLYYSNGILLKRERDTIQEFENKKAQDDFKQAAMNSFEADMKKVVGEKEYNENTIKTYPSGRYNTKDGPFVGYYKNGQKHEEGVFKNGKLDSVYIFYTTEGFKWELHTYKDGALDGQFIRWFYNSKLKQHVRNFRLGVLNGYAYTFFGNGRLQEKTLYNRGLKQGASLSWYKNGRKQKEATYNDDKENGEYRFWYENGQIRDDAVYNKGKLLKCSYLNGKACIKSNDSTSTK
jgi:antitoxin component YwqK of YwqJK toxin-antitoxin module